ncbi:uncharacterized protein LOC112638777 [Camponotus floridanus]|uniref:uncharacterized protein LOC112638777 n=1 Tax=Camponotus floridanus TaxID=104421 RepID=UPI000DC69B39|nr:uncharacterized protein LOC112638777 [Camponotus floridanus]
MDEDERPLRKHLMQRVKHAVKDLAKVASIERLRNRIIVPHTTNSNSSDEEYMDVRVNEGNENINIPQALGNIENEREQEADNEQDAAEVFDLSDDEGIFQDEVDQEDDASESSDDEDINENHFETEEQKANYCRKFERVGYL